MRSAVQGFAADPGRLLFRGLLVPAGRPTAASCCALGMCRLGAEVMAALPLFKLGVRQNCNFKKMAFFKWSREKFHAILALLASRKQHTNYSPLTAARQACRKPRLVECLLSWAVASARSCTCEYFSSRFVFCINFAMNKIQKENWVGYLVACVDMIRN